jgi:hypothetical protein
VIRGIFAVALVGALLTIAIPIGAQSRDASLSTLASYTGNSYNNWRAHSRPSIPRLESSSLAPPIKSC